MQITYRKIKADGSLYRLDVIDEATKATVRSIDLALPAGADLEEATAFGAEILALEGKGAAPRAITAADVRREASRRMQDLVGARNAEHLAVIISNGVREQGRLQAIRSGIPPVVAAREWTEAEASRAADLWAFDQAIEAIRAASNVLETNPPADYADGKHWPKLTA